MRTVVIGATGQLGSALVNRLAGDVIALGHKEVEITDAARVHSVLADQQPQLVINATAYNLVDQAEDEPQVAYAVNALGPRNVAQACAKLDAAILHVSTDFVFGLDTARTVPLTEDCAPGPVSAYGASKLAGEYFVRALCPRHYVVRTCGLYGNPEGSAKGNFVEKMLRLGSERKELSIVNDHQCTPTSAEDLARAILDLVKTEQFGLYHATNSGSTTWCGLAIEVFRLAGLPVQVKPITSQDYPARARRPTYSVLDTARLERAVGYALPSWQDAVARYLQR